MNCPHCGGLLTRHLIPGALACYQCNREYREHPEALPQLKNNVVPMQPKRTRRRKPRALTINP